MNELQLEAERDAKALVAGIPEGGWRTVNPVAVAASLGVKVFDADLPENVAGVLRKNPADDGAIYIQRLDHPRRKRFTAAHEIGHVVLRQKRDEWNEVALVDKRDELATRGTNADEQYANAFAAALLMPQEYLSEMLNFGFSTREIAANLNVSAESLSYRLANLGMA
ncbi:ImmA/IrrE family metallo-endopeptidase [Curtobacterium sp. MCSS17_005]|uniref:ImmA/IrrE family metallo-endopeptidase n=1 Tax=Curtobacterium sp. MCSS17_005 TaxID=2175641 RepID=UPI0015E8C514|nr:ImmA/IrrE family metallo-endopeptidase [Curtobacterium sp. MCSS17_005]WIB31434.1 ImmA/IrrE family metallo-endopeptidase [Curtobacterium sp. MCSS17_005]